MQRGKAARGACRSHGIAWYREYCATLFQKNARGITRGTRKSSEFTTLSRLKCSTGKCNADRIQSRESIAWTSLAKRPRVRVESRI